MFYDWLSIYQDHEQSIPFIGETAEIVINTDTGDQLSVKQPTLKHAGSFSTSIHIRISGQRITVTGNPSRFNRIENLFGLETVDQCVAVYNHVLRSLGLPEFTKCTKTILLTGEEGSRVSTTSDGAIITELHITSNRAVGQGNTDAYIQALSTQRYRHSIPHLHTNGQTVDWRSKQGNAPLIYPSAYCKDNELQLHAAPKLKRLLGEQSKEYQYLIKIIEYCRLHGVVRFEQKLKSRFLRREGLRFWGLSDYTLLKQIHDEFLNIDQKLTVNAMDIENISETLIREGIVNNTKAANTTSMYAIQWMCGKHFDINQRSVETHRARLRRIGIDIAQPCDITRNSPVRVRDVREIEIRDLPVPEWYRSTSVPNLRLVA